METLTVAVAVATKKSGSQLRLRRINGNQRSHQRFLLPRERFSASAEAN